jgi:RiboL-PSP-HEPN
LRLFALFNDWEKYEKPIKEYLNNSMRTNTQFNSAKARRFLVLFPKACESIVKALGAKPFHIRGPLNTSVLDAVFCAVLENDVRAPANAKERFGKLTEDEEFQERTKLSTADTMVVRQRINDVKRYFKLWVGSLAMAHADHFKLADDLIAHLNPHVAALANPFLASRYTGFVSVAALTVYEPAIKEIFCSFGDTKHAVLGNFTRRYFDRINGRVKYRILHEEYVACFGERYVRRFKDKIQTREKQSLTTRRKSVLTSYDNIITWRNQFAHEGQLPTSATYTEAVEAYELGKEVIECLASSMRR